MKFLSSYFATLPLTLLLLFTLFSTSLFAQNNQPVSEGDRIKISADNLSGTFIVDNYADNILHLKEASSEETFRLTTDEINRLRVSQGARSRGAGFLRGAGIGLATGFGAGAIMGFIEGDTGIFSTREVVIINGVFIGTIGAVTGGIIGLIWPGERWKQVDFNVSPTANGAAAGITYRF